MSLLDTQRAHMDDTFTSLREADWEGYGESPHGGPRGSYWQHAQSGAFNWSFLSQLSMKAMVPHQQTCHCLAPANLLPVRSNAACTSWSHVPPTLPVHVLWSPREPSLSEIHIVTKICFLCIYEISLNFHCHFGFMLFSNVEMYMQYKSIKPTGIFFLWSQFLDYVELFSS